MTHGLSHCTLSTVLHSHNMLTAVWLSVVSFWHKSIISISITKTFSCSLMPRTLSLLLQWQIELIILLFLNWMYNFSYSLILQIYFLGTLILYVYIGQADMAKNYINIIIFIAVNSDTYYYKCHIFASFMFKDKDFCSLTCFTNLA